MGRLRIASLAVAPCRSLAQCLSLVPGLSLLLCLAIIWGVTPASAAQTNSLQVLKEQSAIRVAHLLNTFKFVTWPENAVKSDSFVLCVLGDNPFGSSLYDVDGEQTVRSKPVRVVVDIAPHFAKYCHAVYISNSESYKLLERLKGLKGLPLLTVSDVEGFADAGGMVELRYTRDNKVLIRGNPKAAEAEGLRISSKLLTLSK